VIASVLLSIVGTAELSPLATAVALAVAYGFLVSGDAVYWAFTIETTGKNSGTACGMLNTGGNAAGIVTPIVSPWLAGLFGWDVAFYVAGFVACVGLIPLLFIHSTGKDVGASSPSLPS
jgi:MFS family permease